MENAADALVMAGNVLIFIIALTVCISSFSSLRAGIDNIIGQTETVELAKDGTEYLNYMQSRNKGAVRIVGAETVVTSMYRSVKEDYVVYIKLNDLTGIVNDDDIKIMEATKRQYVKDENGNDVKIIEVKDKIIKVTLGTDTWSNRKVNDILNKKLYDKIKGLEFCEYLGEYQENTQINSEDKTTYRVITYIDTKCL